MTMYDQDATRSGADELAVRLQAYALAHLSPAPDDRARVRAAIMSAARTQFALAGSATIAGSTTIATGSATIAGARASWRQRLGFSWRRSFVGLAAAGLAVFGLAGGAVASSPGGPLYGARLWVETLTLPSDASARTDAELVRLQARLSDAETAASTGNGPAVQAALDAYRTTVDETLAAAGGDVTRQARVEAMLKLHLAVLDALRASAGDLPGSAQQALTNALSRSDNAIGEIDKSLPPNGQGTPGGSGPQPTPGANGNGNGNGNRPSPTPSHEPQGHGNGPPATPRGGHPDGKPHAGGSEDTSSNAASARPFIPASVATPRPAPSSKP